MVAFFSRFREEDKIKHLTWSFWITVFALLFLSDVNSLLFAFSIGLSKEIWDHYYGSGFCLYDMTANCFGILLALVFDCILIFGVSLI
jgi:hypothetical protein